MRLVTWNLDGLEERHLDVRTEAACFRLLLSNPPDVVLLQEVVDRSLAAHLKPHFGHAGYAQIVPPSDSEYFVAAFVRAPHRVLKAWSTPFPGSAMGRALLSLHIDIGGREIAVHTAHFESMAEGRKERRRQLAQVVEVLHQASVPSVFGGDTNLRDEELGGIANLDRIHDTYDLLDHPRDLATTWRPRAGKHRGHRFDRVFVAGLGVVRAARIGDERVPEAEGMTVSDHVGIEVELYLPASAPTAANDTRDGGTHFRRSLG